MRNLAAVLSALSIFALAGTAHAASTGASDHFDVAFVAEHASIQPGRPFRVGLQMEPERGWHTYWKNPGDAGLPLRIEWTLPPGFSAGPIEWPVPVRFETGPLVSYGYAGPVLLAVEITPPKTIQAASVPIAAKFDWLECEEVCIPGSATLSLALPVRTEDPTGTPSSRLFTVADAGRPSAPAGWNIAAVAGPRAVALRVRPSAKGAAARGGYFFADQPLVADYAGVQGFERRGEEFRLTFPPAPNRAKFPERLTGVLVLDGAGPRGSRVALEVDLPLAPGDPAPAAAPAGVRPISGAVAAVAAAMAAFATLLIERRSRRPSADSTTRPPETA